MEAKGRKLLIAVALLLFTGLLVSSTQAVTILWKHPNATIRIGLPYRSLEFEDPVAAYSKRVDSYWVLEWLDADYLGLNNFEDWTGNNAGIQGNPDEVWMRNLGHSIWTQTTVSSYYVSIHLNGDNNDGLVDVLVDATLVAKLDMGTAGIPQTALIVYRSGTYDTHTITVNDAGWGPRNRLGDDVATLGACALTPGWYTKWWAPFWYLNARIRLVRTPGYITIPTGFWWGWWWYYDYGYWYRPWYGPMWWYQPYGRYLYYPYWSYWPWYRYYAPWWNYWGWWGGRWFWGFRDRLTYRYWYWQPRIIYWWSWYWDPPGKGGCLELVTQGDEDNPSGGRIKPFESASIPGFEYSGHSFTVNGRNLDSNEFSTLAFTQTGNIESWVRSNISTSDITEDDIAILMDSEIIKQLEENDPCGYGYVGIQYAAWEHPEAPVIPQVSIVQLWEQVSGNDQLTYEVNMPGEYPGIDKDIEIFASEPNRVSIDGQDANGVKTITFGYSNWSSGESVTVRAVPNSTSEGEIRFQVIHRPVDDPNNGVAVDGTITDDECGGMGYNTGDINQDCVVDGHDLAELANDWCETTD